MPRTSSADEAEETIGTVVGWVRHHRDDVIVASDGEPQAVVIPYADYESYRTAKEQRRREAAETLRRLRAEIAARNPDLTEAEAAEIAEQFSRDAVQGLIEKGNLRIVKP